MADQKRLFLANYCEPMLGICQALEAELTPLPAANTPEQFENWRAELSDGEKYDTIIIAQWQADPVRNETANSNAIDWKERFEQPFLLWNFSIGAASQCINDGGSIVVLVQAPAIPGSAGWTLQSAISDGVLALVRSIAAAEGDRGVRINMVISPIGLVDEQVLNPTPPLAGFPGTLEKTVCGAIRMLLSDDASGITGRAIPADGGRYL